MQLEFLFKRCYAYRLKNLQKLAVFFAKKMKTAKINEKIEALESNYSRMYKLEDAQLFEEITKAISEHVTFENENRDSTYRIFDVLDEIADSVQEDFEELVGISNHKKHFIRALTKIFTLLLNTKVDTVDKI